MHSFCIKSVSVEEGRKSIFKKNNDLLIKISYFIFDEILLQRNEFSQPIIREKND